MEPQNLHAVQQIWITCNYGGINTLSQPEKSQQGHDFSADVESFSPSEWIEI